MLHLSKPYLLHVAGSSSSDTRKPCQRVLTRPESQCCRVLSKSGEAHPILVASPARHALPAAAVLELQCSALVEGFIVHGDGALVCWDNGHHWVDHCASSRHLQSHSSVSGQSRAVSTSGQPARIPKCPDLHDACICMLVARLKTTWLLHTHCSQ